MQNQFLSIREKRRYTHQISLEEIGKNGQEKLKRARVIVIGTGGIGSPVLQYLAASGIGKIGVVDDDIVSEENLQRQILYGDSDLGKLKTIIAKQKLMQINSLCQFEVSNIRVTVKNVLRVINDFDIVIDATDNYNTKYLLNDACIKANKVYIFGGIHKYEGQVSVFNYQGGPSLRCAFSAAPDNVEKPFGIYSIAPGTVGLFQVNETIKVITGFSQPLSGKLLMINLFNYQFNLINIQKIEKNFDNIQLS